VAGIAGLLRQIHPDLPIEVAETTSRAILTHPLITSDGKTLGTVVHREELIALILELAADEGSVQLAQEAKKRRSEEAKKRRSTSPIC